MVRQITWKNQSVITYTDEQYEEQIALMKEVGITEYTVEELHDYELPSPPSSGWIGTEYKQQTATDYLEEWMKQTGLHPDKT